MTRRLGNILITLLLAACATTDTDIFPSDPVVRPGARIELGAVTVAPEKSYEVDAAGMMRSAMQSALAERGIAWQDEPDSERFVLNLTVQDYEPGSAFQRWLLPGLGTTILHVTGELIDLSTGKRAGEVDHERGIYAGGAYTIGGWEKIFQTVANDIATELDNRINNKGFVVSLKPWPARDLDIPEANTRDTFTINEVTDSRAERGRIGERTAAFGVGMGDVFFDRSVPAFIEEAVAAELIGAGHQIANDSSGRSIAIDVKSFWTHTDTTALYWDVVGNIQIGVTVGINTGDQTPKQETFDCESTTRTYVWPTVALVSEVMDKCLTQLMGKLRSDSVWDRS